jgi:hypothetical protein
VLIEDDMKHLKIDITFNEQESDNSFSNAQPVHMGIQCVHFIEEKLQEYPSLE